MSVPVLSLATLQAFKDLESLDGTEDDDLAQAALNQGTRLIQMEAGARGLVPNLAATRTFDAPYGAYLRVPDLSVATTVHAYGVLLVVNVTYRAILWPDGLSIWGLLRLDGAGVPISWVPLGTLLPPYGAIAILGDWGVIPTPDDLVQVNLAVAAILWRDRGKLFVDGNAPIAQLGREGANAALLPPEIDAAVSLYWREPYEAPIGA